MSAVELATAYISIVPSIKGLEGHLATALHSSEAEAKHAGEKAGEGFGGGFAERMKHVAEIAGLYEIGAKLKEFASDSIKYYMDVQRINAQTTTVITSTGGAANVTAEHISKLSEELEAKTATEARSIQSGANMMLTFTGVKNAAGEGNDVFDQSVSVITDLSRVMGQDTKQSAIQLGKALNDPVTGMTALKRVGVSFSADQKDQIKGFVAANNIMGAQKVILAEMNKEFGGSGESYAKTMAGQQDLFKEATDKLGGSLVGILAPALTTATTGLTGMLTKATEWVQKSGVIQSGFTTLKDGAQPLISALKNIWGGFEDLAVKAWPYIRTFAVSVGAGFKSVYDFIVPVIKGVGDFVKNLSGGDTVSTFGGIVTGLGHAFQDLMKWVAPLGTVVGGLIGFLGQLPGPIWAGVAALAAMNLLSGPLAAIPGAIVRIGTSVMQAFSAENLTRITAMIGVAGVFAVGMVIVNSFNETYRSAKAVQDSLAGSVQAVTDVIVAQGGAWNATGDAALEASVAGQPQFQELLKRGASYGDIMDLVTGKTKEFGASFKNVTLKGLDPNEAMALGAYALQLQDIKPRALEAAAAVKKWNDQQAADAKLAADQPAFMAARKNQQDSYVDSLKARGRAAVAEQDNEQNRYVDSLNLHAITGAAALKKQAIAEAAANKAGAAAAVAATKKEYDTGYVHASLVYDNFQAHVAGLHMTVSADGIKTFQTDSEIAFAKFNTDAQAAATQASLFWFAMEDPTKVTTQQTIYADAAAIRAVGAAYRSAAANTAAVTTAQDALTKAQNAPLAAGETQAQHLATVAAAQRSLDDAKATAAGNDAAVFAAQQTAGQTAAKMVQDIAAHTTTYGEAVKKVTDYLTTERASFISSQESAGASATAANAAADAIGLIPSKTETIITADNYQALKKADEASSAGVKLAKQKVEAQLTANNAMHKKTLDEANRRVLANKRATLSGDPLPFNGVVATVNGVQLPGKTVKIGADASGLSADVQAAIDLATVAIETWVPPSLLTGPVGVGSSVYGASDYKFPAPGKAGGGDIFGRGTGTSDSVPFWGSTGEFVSTAASTARHHAQLVAWNAAPGKAAGGDLRPMQQTGAAGGPLIGTVIQQPGQSPWQLAADLDRRMAFMGGR